MKATPMESLEDQKWSMWLQKLVVVGLVVACALPFANIGADAASSKCPKAGKQQIVGKVKYLCVKSGKSLIWQIQKPSTTTATASTTTTTVVDLSVDSSISTAEKLTAISDCKIPFIAGGAQSSGFPRSASLPPSTGTLKILVVPLIFDDLPYTTSTASLLKDSYEKVKNYYKSVSYGRAGIDVSFADPSLWVTLSGTASSRMDRNQTKTPLVREAIGILSSRTNLAPYDLVSFVTGVDSRQFGSEGFGAGSGTYATNARFPATLDTGENVGKWRIIAHEIGHAWLGYQDLYGLSDSTQYVGGWDLMELPSSAASELISWHRFLSGWISDSLVRCVSRTQVTTNFIAPLSSNKETAKSIVVKLGSNTALVIERRMPTEFDAVTDSVIVYLVDTSIATGAGPIRLRGALTKVGDQVTTDGVKISIIKMNSTGSLIEVAPA
jgi:hypothetical protein